MKALAVLILLCFFVVQVNSAGYRYPIKTTVIRKFRQYLCTWLTEAQFVTLFDTLEPQLTETTKVEDLQPMLISAAMAITTLSQKFAVGTLGLKMMGKAPLDVPIGILATALANNIQPFSAQIIEMWIDYRDSGETRDRIFQRAYKMIDMFMTKKRVGTIYCRVKLCFDKTDVTWWPFLKTTLSAQLLWSTLDSLGPISTCKQGV